MNSALVLIAAVLGGLLLLSGVVRLLITPFAVAFEVLAASRRRLGESIPEGSLSIIVPAYNEAVVLERCVVSLVETAPSGSQIIVVDDGSTDATGRVAAQLAARFEQVRAITRTNGGKGAALNTGLDAATGDFLLLTDADGIWPSGSIDEMLRGFADPRVGAICGDDRPVNLDVTLTKFLSVISHVGTGLMRRAYSLMRCLPIVSGNSGCFRREALEQVGGLREDTLGEDLELTWRVQAGGWRVVFRPRAIVYAETPARLSHLWRQRIRWARGLFQTLVQHRSVIGNPRYGVFGLSLLPLTFSSIVLPLVQLLAFPTIALLLASGELDAVPGDLLAWLLWLSIPVAVGLVILACTLNRALGDLRFAWTLLAWPLFSVWMSWVALTALMLELRGTERAWNKLDRGGVVSVAAVLSALAPKNGGLGGRHAKST